MTRRDLPLPQQAVQACHATYEAAKSFPCDTHPHFCLCAVRDEARLHLEMEKLRMAGIQVRAFYEPDRNNELTAFATEAISGEKRRHFRNFQLLRTEEAVAA